MATSSVDDDLLAQRKLTAAPCACALARRGTVICEHFEVLFIGFSGGRNS